MAISLWRRVGLASTACLLIIGAAAAAHAQATFETVHQFAGGMDGAMPYAGLIQATDGNFYGTTLQGGNGATTVCHFGGTGCGTVYRMTPAGTVTILHAFTGGDDGDAPSASLVQGFDGNLYGTTTAGGIGCGSCGTVFRVALDGTFTALHTFTPTLGGSTRAALIQASDGNFYGTFGNKILKITPDGTTTLVHDFTFTSNMEGSGLDAPLMQALDGTLYGTTSNGGGGDGSGHGTIFKMTLAGTVAVLHTFTDVAGGTRPGNGLIQGTDGNFYGLTFQGGTADRGTIFKMTTGGVVTVLTSLTNINGPHYTSLLQGTDGNFYGTSTEYAFVMTPSGTLTQLHSTGGFIGPLIHGRDGFYYGVRFDSSFDHPGSAGDVYRIGNTASCDDALTLSDTAGTLHLGFTLKSQTPASWSAWIVIQGHLYTLWSSIALPAIGPAVFLDFPIAGFPPVGQVFLLTTLTSGSGSCFDWKTVNTH